MCNYEFPPLGGGAANANEYLLSALADRSGVAVDLVTSSPEGYREERFGDDVRVIRLDVGKEAVHYWTQAEILRYSWRAYRKARSLSNQNDYDVVHAWFGVPSGIIARLLGLPYVVALRGSDVPGYNDRFAAQYVLLKPLIRRIWRDAEAVVANSSGLRDLALETADVPIDVIPNGVAVEEFEPADHAGRTDPDEPMCVLCVSRLIERKGIRYLLEAVADLDVSLTVVGDGDRSAALRQRAVRLGIDDRVTFAGYVPHEEIHDYYESADVFVLPSKNEGMSNTVLEAMAAGLPVVMTDTGGAAELIDGNGIVVGSGDSDAIASALLAYDRDRNLRVEHGRISRTIAESMSWEAVADQYLRTYEAVAGDTESDAVELPISHGR